jgi:predicted TIM-barrel fold metal-dependent hydrolase
VQSPMDCVAALRDKVGIQRLVFGSNLPFIVPESPIMEIADARLSEEEDAAIRFKNAEAAFGLARS